MKIVIEIVDLGLPARSILLHVIETFIRQYFPAWIGAVYLEGHNPDTKCP